MCYAWMLSLFRYGVLRCKKRFGKSILLQYSRPPPLSSQNIETCFIQQPIVELVLHHLFSKKKNKFGHVNNITKETW
jgi:hypothetical protein